MGANISTEAFDPAHVRIYSNILHIQNPATRAQMIQTCMAGHEFIASSKRAGLYSYLLGYVSAVQSGHTPRPLPGEGSTPIATGGAGRAPAPRQQIAPPMTGSGSGATNSIQVPRSMAPPPQLQMQISSYRNSAPDGPVWQQMTISRERKAVTYFASCLEVLGIQEEVALTPEALKKAYKRMAVRSHPDKGGSEEQFEAVTRAYAYLSDIILRIQGGRERAPGVVDAPTVLEGNRTNESQAWQHTEPVRLNPKNLDMNAFNQMFEQTHIPDPDTDGYGDWLTSAEGGKGSSSAPKFSGKFNRDVFNTMFDDESRRQGSAGKPQSSALVLHPDAMAILPTMGVEIGRDRPETYTAAPSQKQQYTDLRAAYTTESTFSGKVANVQVENRQYDTYRAQRESAPVPLSSEEMQMLHSSEREIQMREDMRQRRVAERGAVEQNYFDRMKQLVITDGATNLNSGMGGGGGARRR